MMIPEAWENDGRMASARRAFYGFHSAIMEAWDGPALVVATDGRQIGAVLDRNGFRPCRYSVTRDRRLVLASEVGVLDLDDANVTVKGRLKPGELLLVDAERGLFLGNQQDQRERRPLHAANSRRRKAPISPSSTVNPPANAAHPRGRSRSTDPRPTIIA